MNELTLKNENNATVANESYRSITARSCNDLRINGCTIDGGNKYKTQRAIYLRNCVDATVRVNETFNAGAGLMAIDCPGLQVTKNIFHVV